MTGAFNFWPHYEVKQTIRTMQDIRDFFPGGEANEFNWCFLSTSGVHGGYSTLDEMHEPEEDEDENGNPIRITNRHITVLIIQTRLVVMRYGNVDVETEEDEKWLRKLVASSIKAVAKSQEGNV